MNFLADENFPVGSANLLREKGHNVRLTSSSFPGQTDTFIIEQAGENNEVIITFDTDFGELIFKENISPPAGIVLFRLTSFTPESPGERIISSIEKEQVEFIGYFTVITKDKLRQRKISGV